MLAVVALVGRLVALFAAFMLVPLAFAVIGHDGGQRAFALSTLVTAGLGGAMSLVARRFRRELQPRDGFVLVSLTWTLLPAASPVNCPGHWSSPRPRPRSTC